MSKEEKIKYQDLLTLLEEAKGKVKVAGLVCDTIYMSPKVYDLVVAALKDLSGLEKAPVSNIMFSGLKLVKSKLVPENIAVFAQQGKVKKIEEWDLEGLEDNGSDSKTKKTDKEERSA